MILIVASPGDDHAREVITRCAQAGLRPALLDTERYPLDLPVRQRFGDGSRSGATVQLDGHDLDLGSVGAVWWRRPGAYLLDPDLDPSVQTFAYSECSEAVDGLWASLDAAWVNPLTADATAHHKPYQLAVADRIGLSIPRTLMTNDAAAARDFVTEVGLGKVVHKTFLATQEHRRETRLLREEELAMLEHLRHAPAIFRELGLVYGAIDLLRTRDGAEVFLEINPAGEWLFAQQRTGQDITGAMAALLDRLDHDETAATVRGPEREEHG